MEPTSIVTLWIIVGIWHLLLDQTGGMLFPVALDAGSMVGFPWRGGGDGSGGIQQNQTGQKFPHEQGGSITKKSKLAKNNATTKQCGIA